MEKGKMVIGLVGLGTVGEAIVNLLEKRKREFRENRALSLIVKRIADKDSDKKRKIKIAAQFSINCADILDDEEVGTIIEAIGGIEAAKDIIVSALKKGKSVITANKALLAESGKEIFAQAIRQGAFLGYRAAVTGCHEILPYLRSAGMIKGLCGIFNATTNYVLTQMEEKNFSLEQALKKAKAAGYAEADPHLDINGWDTVYKLVIVSRLAFGGYFPLQGIYVEGLKGITREDISFARELGYKIRLLGIARRVDRGLHLCVHPCLIPQEKSLARIKGIANSLQIEDLLRGRAEFSAPGAGGAPAASAVIADLLDLAEGIPMFLPRLDKKLRIKNIRNYYYKYYLNFRAINRPGVLAKIARILGQSQINILSILQKGRESQKIVPLVLMTGEAKEENMLKAIERIKKIKEIKNGFSLIRVEEKSW